MQTRSVLVSLEEVLASGALDGYVPGVPEAPPYPIELDLDAVSRSNCAHCGRRTIAFRPFVRVRGAHGYRAFGRCRICGHTEAV